MPDQGQISSRDQPRLVECLRAVGEEGGGGEGRERRRRGRGRGGGGGRGGGERRRGERRGERRRGGRGGGGGGRGGRGGGGGEEEVKYTTDTYIHIHTYLQSSLRHKPKSAASLQLEMGELQLEMGEFVSNSRGIESQ